MHSKVIIASLVIALAAGFNSGGKIASSPKKTAVDTGGSISCAPNDEQNYFTLNGESGRVGDTISAGLNYEGTISNFRLLYKSSALQVTTSTSNGYHANITSPSTSGDFYATFGYTTNGRSRTRTVYVYSDGTNYCASMLSKFDARAKFFMSYRATSGESYWLSYTEDPYTYDTYSNEVLDAEKRLGDFTFSGSNDIQTSISSSTASSDTVRLRVIAKWYEADGSTSHPLAGIKTNFITANDTVIKTGDGFQCTDEQGYYTVTLTKQQASNYMRKDIQVRMSTISAATRVEDSQLRSYAFVRTEKSYTSSTYTQSLSNYAYITYYINVYPSRSDRAAAYEIAEAEIPTYQYINAFTDGVDYVRTRYPSYSTEYRDYPWYQHIIDVQKEDYNNWDLLSHEYAHYAEEMLNIGHYFSFSTRMPHTVHENLINRYGASDGKALAYHEGLATYIGLASQLYYKQYHSSFTAPNFANLVYSDTYRGLSVNYGTFAPGKSGNNTIVIEGVESAVTSTMIKLLDSTTRNGDNVALGHQKMWNAILSTGGYSDFDYFLSNVKSQNQSRLADIEYLLCLERNQCQPVTPNSTAEWTVMLYMYAADLPAYDNISEILSVPNQPSNVNIIIETDCRYHDSLPQGNFLYRYHVRNNNLYLDQIIPYTRMCYESTFESFLRWGFNYYPANKTGVVLYDHGRGVNGVCFDDYGLSYEEGLVSSETDMAFRNVLGNNPSTKLEFIGYDACLMQVQDVAEFNSKYFKYQVASEEETSADNGWAYDLWIDNLYRNESTYSIVKEIAYTFAHQPQSYLYAWEQCMSVVNLTAMEGYLEAFNHLSDVMSPVVATNFAAFESIMQSQHHYGYGAQGSNGAPYALVDVVNTLTSLLEDDVFSQFHDEIWAVLNYFPNLDDYGYDQDGYFSNEGSIYDVVQYSIASLGRAGSYSTSHGLSLHYWDDEFDIIYPIEDTHFYSWRDLFMEPEVASIFTWQPAPSHYNPGERRWFRFVAPQAGTYYFESESNLDTFVDLFHTKVSDTTIEGRIDYNDDAGPGNNFRIGIYLNANQKIYLRVRGWSSSSSGNFTVTASYTPVHTHSYTEYGEGDSEGHRVYCACGSYIVEEHSYDSMIPYGHGHNATLVCSKCGHHAEIRAELYVDDQYQSSIDAYDCEWFRFVAPQDGTYRFETTGNYDPCCDVYLGEYPTGNGEYYDDEGTGNNFMFTKYLRAGDIIYLRVRGYDWYHDVSDYTLHVTRVN